MFPTKVQQEQEYLGPMDHLLSQLSQAPEWETVPNRNLEILLGQVLRKVRVAWPNVTVPDEVFVPYLGKRLAAQPKKRLDVALSHVRAEDLYLACACAHGDSVAIAEFDREFLARTASVIAGIDASPAFVDEVQQELRRKLFAPENRPGSIASYNGVGTLKRWLRSTAVREALYLAGRSKREVGLNEQQIQPKMSSSDLELKLLKIRHRADFNAAFETALASLTKRERTLLNFHFLDGLSIDKIGAIYHIDRSTAARWLARAREKIVESCKAALQQRLNVRGSELNSLMRVLRAEIDITVSRLLRFQRA